MQQNLYRATCAGCRQPIPARAGFIDGDYFICATCKAKGFAPGSEKRAAARASLARTPSLLALALAARKNGRDAMSAFFAENFEDGQDATSFSEDFYDAGY